MKSISYLQNHPEYGKKTKNIQAVASLVQGLKTDLLVLPELFATGYAFSRKQQVADMAEDVNGETIGFLTELAQQIGGVVTAGYVEKHKNSVYNSSVMVNNEGVVTNYRKIHLFNKETLWFSSGNLPYEVVDIQGMKVGMMICFDWFFPESMRTLALKGADVVAHPCNLVLPYCQQAMKTRCLENHLFAITANRVGADLNADEHVHFTGQSQITGTLGELLVCSNATQTHVQTIQIDPTQARQKQINPYNDLLTSRQPLFYELN